MLRVEEKNTLRKTLIIVVAVVAIIIIAASAAWIYTNNPLNPVATPTPTPEASAQEQARDGAINYIQTNHADTAPLFASLSWTGGRTTPESIVGAETYTYTSGSWTLTVQYPVIPNPVYTINATYTSGTTAVDWQGTYENSTITETSYTYTP